MPRPRPEGPCKKHPKHKQAPGVCSICLSEKLSRLRTIGSSRGSGSTNVDSCSSSCSSLSSCSSSVSSCSSPMYAYRFPSGSFGFLKKSRSMAFVSRMRRSGENGDKKKSGFWSKLLRPGASDKRVEDRLVHSRTTRESIIT